MGYVGSYMNFLLIQESKYSWDEDSEIIVYNEYARPHINNTPVNSDDDETNVELQE